MALFKGATFSAAPLRIQVTAPAGAPIYVVGFNAAGEDARGATSRPILTRPSTLGSGTGTAIPVSPTGPPTLSTPEGMPTTGNAQATVVTSFRSSPSVPSVHIGSYNLPMRVVWQVPLSQAMVVPASDGVLLYALTVGSHTWCGEITWEEK